MIYTILLFEFYCQNCLNICLRRYYHEIYKLASNMLQANFSSLLLSNQKEIMKKGLSWTEQKPSGTPFKVQSIAIANPLYIDFKHQCCVKHKHCGQHRLMSAQAKESGFHLRDKSDNMYSVFRTFLVLLKVRSWKIGSMWLT